MEKLSREEYDQLIQLVDSRRDSIRQKSYSDPEVYEEYVDLGMISIKLNSQKKINEREEKENSL